VIIQLPCRGLGPLKREICEVLSRSMGGDLSSIPGLRADARPAEVEPPVEGGEATEAQVVLIDDFRADLARLLQKDPEELGRIRKVEGSPPRYSLVDVMVCITGQRIDHAKRTLDEVLLRDEDVTHQVGVIPLVDATGRRMQRTPVADIQTVLRVIIQLPCRGLGPLKREICEIFVRFMGGDLSLLPELMANHAHQQALQQEGSEAPESAFGEYVRSTRPPEPIVVLRSLPADGTGDYDCKHYVLASTKYPNLFKTGSTKKNVDERLRKIRSDQPSDLGLYIYAVHHHEGIFEYQVRVKLDTWGYQKPPAEWGTKGVEFRVGPLQGILEAIDAVKKEHDARMEARNQVRSEDDRDAETEAQCKRRRMCLQVRREEFELAQKERSYKLDMAQKELALEEQRFDLEKRRASWRRSLLI